MRIIYIIAGITLILIGIVGLALPIFPTVPFILLALLCFAKVSPRFKAFLKTNRFYKKHISKYEVDGKIPIKKLIPLGIGLLLLILAFAIVVVILLQFLL